MSIGQVAVMRLLSALFFIGRKTTAIESARLFWRAACPQDSSRGMPTNKRSPFCIKGHCLPVLKIICI